jgi:hypothetical protein
MGLWGSDEDKKDVAGAAPGVQPSDGAAGAGAAPVPGVDQGAGSMPGAAGGSDAGAAGGADAGAGGSAGAWTPPADSGAAGAGMGSEPAEPAAPAGGEATPPSEPAAGGATPPAEGEDKPKW